MHRVSCAVPPPTRDTGLARRRPRRRRTSRAPRCRRSVVDSRRRLRLGRRQAIDRVIGRHRPGTSPSDPRCHGASPPVEPNICSCTLVSHRRVRQRATDPMGAPVANEGRPGSAQRSVVSETSQPKERWCMESEGRLGGRRVLVTGASSGIGAATCRSVVARGGSVAMLARRKERLEDIGRGTG